MYKMKKQLVKNLLKDLIKPFMSKDCQEDLRKDLLDVFVELFRILEYITGKLTINKEGNSEIIKTLNEILDRIGKDNNEKIETEIEDLIKAVHKSLVEPQLYLNFEKN